MVDNKKKNSLTKNKGGFSKEKENKFNKEQPIRHALAEVERHGDQIKINQQLYKVLINKNEALDLTMLTKKYDTYLDQYDFLVGDISSEHLRLKGFYQPGIKTTVDRRAQSIADYLFEYCNPGSPYFILQLLNAHHTEPHKRRKNYSTNNFKTRRVKATNFAKKSTIAVKCEPRNHHSFVIKKRKDSKK